jgi:hypothetical protein
MSTELITSDRGIVAFDLPACPKCGKMPTSDFVRVWCGCPGSKPEDPEQYIKRCALEGGEDE